MKKTIIILTMCLGILDAAAQHPDFPNPTIRIVELETSTDVRGYLVSDNGSNRMTEVTIGFNENPASSVNKTITLNPGIRRQKMDGFGFAITGSAAYNLKKMDAGQRHAFLTQIYSTENGYGSSYVRIPIGCSDFSLSEYTCCDKPGIENFALTSEETEYIIPVMKEILEINPDVKVMSAPWTAPRWMKTNGGWTDGNLKKECYDDYGTYFVKWIQAFEKEGIDIYGVTPQNEPLNRGNSASMYMGWTEARDFIKNSLGPKIQAAGLDTKIYVFDHNYNYDNDGNQWSYPTKIYDDPEANKYVAGAAYHNYGGSASEMSRVHNQYPDKELVFTEWTAGDWSSPGWGINAVTTDAQALIYDVVWNWGNGSIVWNLMLCDRGPNRPGGCTNGNGAVDIKSNYRDIDYNSFYYVMCIAASAINNESVNIGFTEQGGDINCVAFDNGNGSYSVILMNTSDSSRKVRVKEGDREFVADIPGKTLASYRW